MHIGFIWLLWGLYSGFGLYSVMGVSGLASWSILMSDRGLGSGA